MTATVTTMGKRRPRPRGSQATLADVARAAAVSTASASRALTRPEVVSDELRIRVSEAANTLGYVANSAARALACRRAGSVGVVTGNLADPGMAAALAALEARLTGAGWDVLLGSGEDGTTLARARVLVSRGVGALVFLGVDLPSELREVRGIHRLPCVSVDRTDRTSFIASTGLDLSRAGKLVADYLGQLGHRCMAVVAEPGSGISVLMAEAVSAHRALDESSLEIMHTSHEPIAEGILRWLALWNAPTAAICCSDATALALMHACACHGIDVPGRLSVVGFGDSPLARCVSPTLTSVRIPARAAGIAAAEYLLARFAGGIADRRELPVKLALRGSTGAPPGAR